MVTLKTHTHVQTCIHVILIKKNSKHPSGVSFLSIYYLSQILAANTDKKNNKSV